MLQTSEGFSIKPVPADCPQIGSMAGTMTIFLSGANKSHQDGAFQNVQEDLPGQAQNGHTCPAVTDKETNDTLLIEKDYPPWGS